MRHKILQLMFTFQPQLHKQFWVVSLLAVISKMPHHFGIQIQLVCGDQLKLQHILARFIFHMML